MTKPDRKPVNRIIGFRKQLRQFIEDYNGGHLKGKSIAELLQAVDEKALEYLETK